MGSSKTSSSFRPHGLRDGLQQRLELASRILAAVQRRRRVHLLAVDLRAFQRGRTVNDALQLRVDAPPSDRATPRASRSAARPRSGSRRGPVAWRPRPGPSCRVGQRFWRPRGSETGPIRRRTSGGPWGRGFFAFWAALRDCGRLPRPIGCRALLSLEASPARNVSMVLALCTALRDATTPSSRRWFS